jgi:hypothetical protein
MDDAREQCCCYRMMRKVGHAKADQTRCKERERFECFLLDATRPADKSMCMSSGCRLAEKLGQTHLQEGRAFVAYSTITSHVLGATSMPNARLTGAHKAYPERCGVSASVLNLQLCQRA